MKVFVPIFCLMLIFALPGCIITSKSAQEMDQLKAQIAQLEQQQADLKERLSGMGDKSAESYLASEQLRQEVAILRGRFEESGFNAEKFSTEAKALHEFMEVQLAKVDKRLSALEKQAGIQDAPALDKLPPMGSAASSSVVAADDSKDDPEKLYKKAYNDFKSSNLEAGKAKFRKFLQKHPDHKLAPSAQFHLAECYYKQRDFENAILEYDKVAAKYPSSKLTRAAYLNVGFAFIELGSKPDAKLFFEKVIADFPGTEEAQIAKKKLELLN